VRTEAHPVPAWTVENRGSPRSGLAIRVHEGATVNGDCPLWDVWLVPAVYMASGSALERIRPGGSVIDFSVPEATERHRQKIQAFVSDTVIPREEQAYSRGVNDSLRLELQAAAREAGLWAPQASIAIGGGGFDLVSSAILLEEAGYSLLGPMALNCAAPDEGNIHLLNKTANEQQRMKYLFPLVAGEMR
jgi:hypothetical protein